MQLQKLLYLLWHFTSNLINVEVFPRPDGRLIVHSKLESFNISASEKDRYKLNWQGWEGKVSPVSQATCQVGVSGRSVGGVTSLGPLQHQLNGCNQNTNCRNFSLQRRMTWKIMHWVAWLKNCQHFPFLCPNVSNSTPPEEWNFSHWIEGRVRVMMSWHSHVRKTYNV